MNKKKINELEELNAEFDLENNEDFENNHYFRNAKKQYLFRLKQLKLKDF